VSRLRLSDLQRAEVVTEDGRRLGHLFDLASIERPGEPPVVRALLVGAFGLARRLGLGRGHPSSEIGVEDIVEIEEGRIVVRRTVGR
jgi:sporulation protein YlmC with PRC-barrel domain